LLKHSISVLWVLYHWRCYYTVSWLPFVNKNSVICVVIIPVYVICFFTLAVFKLLLICDLRDFRFYICMKSCGSCGSVPGLFHLTLWSPGPTLLCNIVWSLLN
jgi:hypothetical protein